MKDMLVGLGVATLFLFVGFFNLVGLIRPEIVVSKIKQSEVFFYGREISKPGPSWLIRLIGGMGTTLAVAAVVTILRRLFK